MLASLGATEQLTYHLGLAKQNGNTETELRLAATCVCGSDLWLYRGIEATRGSYSRQPTVYDQPRSLVCGW